MELQPGCCFQATCSQSSSCSLSGEQLLYVNILGARNLPGVFTPAGVELPVHKLEHLGNCRVPLDVGNRTADSVDVLVNSDLLADRFRDDLVRIALTNVQEVLGLGPLKLHKILTNKKYHNMNFPTDFVSVLSGTQAPPVPDSTMPSKSERPAGRCAVPAVQRGFFNRKNVCLYPEGGSGEGNLPEGAGDPMGWMPASLRKKLLVVNTPPAKEAPTASQTVTGNFQVKENKLLCTFEGVEAAQAAELQISDRTVQLGGQRFALPRPVDSTSAQQAKFSSKHKRLSVEINLV